MWAKRLLRAALAAIVLGASVLAGGWEQRVSADVPPDYDIPVGHFFTQTNGAGQGRNEPTGYAVSNEGGVPLWDEFKRLGGVAALGYPISRRFNWNGFTVQAFQKGVLQWQTGARQGMLVNVFDLMHDGGKDNWLQNFRSTPPPLAPDFDGGKQWPAVLAARQALLNDNPAIKQRYFASADPLTFYGLPTSRVVDNGNHYVVRLQRAVIQQWKIDTPWAKAGQVTVANGGEIAKEAGILPADAVALDLPPWGAGRVVAIDPGHGGNEIGATYRFSDGTTIAEKDLNLRVALKVADLLTRAGYKPVLTRTTDSSVNVPAKLITRKLPIGLDDELQARIDIANKSGAKLFLSIHFNGHKDSRLRGAEIYYCRDRPFATESLRFARLLLDNLERGLLTMGYKDDDAAVKDDSQALSPDQHFYLLGPANEIIVRPSEMPSALAEGLFVTNATDASHLRVERTLDVIARSYATAVHQYFVDSKAELPVSVPTVAPAPKAPLPPPTPTPQQPTPQPTAVSKPPSQPVTPPALGQGTVETDFGGGGNLRVQPATTAAVLRAIPNGARIDLLQQVNGEAVVDGDKRWYRARYDGAEGFVYGAVVKTGSSPPGNVAPPSNKGLGKGVVSTDTGNGAMLRAEPKTSAQIVRPLAEDESVELLQQVTGETIFAGDARWYRARYDGEEGYLYAQLVKTQSGATANPTPAPSNKGLGKGVVSTDTGNGAMLRAEPKTSGQLVRPLAEDESVELLQQVTGETVWAGDARWYRARYDGEEGYLYAQLVKPQSGAAANPAPAGKGLIATEFGGGALLRAQTNTAADVVRSVPDGDSVELLHTVTGEAVVANNTRWYRARYDGTEGYLYGELVKPI